MNITKKPKSLCKRILAFSFLALVPAFEASAISWSEVGDAGQEIGTAQITSGSGSLDSISGTLFDTGDLYGDIDIYQIFIDATDIFSVAVSSSLSEDDDIALWLFDALGEAIFDDSGANETFDVWDDIGGEPAGLYYLGLSLYGREPANDDPLDGWEEEADPYQFGSYTLTLEGASFAQQIPDAGSTLAFLAFGLVGVTTLRRRFNR